jgi:hypothetical protein
MRMRALRSRRKFPSRFRPGDGLAGFADDLKNFKNFSGLFGKLCYIPAPLKHRLFKIPAAN